MRSGMLLVVFLLVVAGGAVVVAQGNGKYGGTDNCKMCHPDIHTDWAKTAHAQAYELLVNVGQEKNAECLPCHTTGYGKGGFEDGEKTPSLKGVTCEACHGPSGEHMGDKTKVQRTPAGTVCAGCHQNNGIHSVPSK